MAPPITWFSLAGRGPLLAARVAAGGDACYLDAGELVLERPGARTAVVRVEEAPVTVGGAARYNVSNALTSVGLAAALDLPADAVAVGLRGFRGELGDDPGRGNLLEIGGATVILDFAHNPHGRAALVELALALPASRRRIVQGQAGDRDDAAIRELTRVACRLRPDRVVVKELRTRLRGRPAGEVAAVIEDELVRQGVEAEAVLDLLALGAGGGVRRGTNDRGKNG